MTTHISKVDANQGEIVEALEKAGCNVESLAAVGHGVPDLLVGYAGRLYVLECKKINGKLTPPQVGWHRRWQGYAQIVHSGLEALRAVGAVESESEQ
jgi:hypothetical protein